MTIKTKTPVATGAGKRNQQDNVTTTSTTRQASALNKFVTGEQIRAKFVECSKELWTVEGILPESSALTCVFGKYGSYKSFAVLDLILSVATDEPYHGKKVVASPVLYVCAEGAAGFWKRVIAWHKHHKLEKISDNISVFDGAVNLNDKQTRADFISNIKLLPNQPGIIVFDTLARCFGGKEENANSDMSAFVTACDEIGQTIGSKIIIVHHSGKDSSKGARGGSSLPAAVDTEICITAPLKGVAQLTITKQKNFDAGSPLKFKMQPVTTDETDAEGKAIDSLVPELITTENASDVLTENAQTALNALSAAGGKGISSGDWRKAFDKYRLKSSPNDSEAALKAAFYRAQSELKSKDKISCNGRLFSIAE